MPYCLSFYGTSINGKISKVRQQFLGTVLASHELEEVWGIINELQIDQLYEVKLSNRNTHSGPGLSANEDVVGEEAEKERNVRLLLLV